MGGHSKAKARTVAETADALLWDVAETRRQLGGISRRTLERYDDELGPVHIGRRRMYRPERVRAFVRARTMRAAS